MALAAAEPASATTPASATEPAPTAEPARALASTSKRLKRRAKRLQQPRKAYASAAYWHQCLGHVGPAVIDHLVRPAPKDDPKGRKTLNSVNVTAWDAPATNKCKICAISKAHEIVFRHMPDMRNNKPFKQVCFNIILMNELFNMSQYYVHINDKYTLY
jgi:hypothetical protein